MTTRPTEGVDSPIHGKVQMFELDVPILLVGGLTGLAISWLVAHRYYVRSGIESRAEPTELTRLSLSVLRALENAGIAKLNKDADGNIQGVDLTNAATIGAVSNVNKPDLRLE